MADDFQTQSIFGGAANTSQMLPGEWNPSGQTPDWGSIIADGVQNTVRRLTAATVGDKFNSGELGYYGTPQQRTQSLLIVGLMIYLILN